MASNTVTTIDGMLKQIYKRGKLEDLTLKNNKWLGLIPKREDFGGRNLPVPVLYTAGQGRSHSFTKAQTGATAMKIEDFLVTRAKDYQVDTIEGEAIAAAESDMESFMNSLTLTIDQALQNIAGNLAIELYKNGGGARGQVNASGGGATTITLLDIEDIVNFELGMILDTSTTDGTSGSADGGAKTVGAINRDTGVLTTSDASNWNSAGHFSASDYIFVDGDFGAAIKGLDAWCPSAAPGATSFFGVDRSVDSRLGGNRVDASTTPIPVEEALLRADEKIYKMGGEADLVLMNPENYSDLRIALGSKVQYGKMQAASGNGKEIASIGFGGIVVHGCAGNQLTVVADPRCQHNVAWVLQKDTWCLASKGQAPRLLDFDGMRLLRVYNSDSYEIRAGHYANAYCTKPNANARVALA